MMAEFDDHDLERMLRAAGEAIDVPADGPSGVLHAVRAVPANRGGGEQLGHDAKWGAWRWAAAAAAMILVVGIAVAAFGPIHHGSPANDRLVARARAVPPPTTVAAHGTGNLAATGTRGGTTNFGTVEQLRPAEKTPAASKAPIAPPSSESTATDAPKIEATGEAVLEVGKGSVTAAAAAVTTVAKGAGGYVADDQSTGGASPSADITIRVPYTAFDRTVVEVGKLAPSFHGKVLSTSTHSADVTAQYTDVRARRDAAVQERDQLDLILDRAQTIGDVLAVHDRISAVQTQIDQLDGQLKVLDSQTTYSSLAVSISQTAPPTPKPAAAPESGIHKSLHDAREGFAHSVEWIIARSGKGLVVLVACIALLFLLRYLYPVVRRGLL